MSAPSSGEGLTKCHPLTGDAPLHKGATKSGTIEGAAQTIEGAAQLTQKANKVLKNTQMGRIALRWSSLASPMHSAT